jgi:hypothetical protein
MSRSPGSARALELQSLKQASASTVRAIELFNKDDRTSDAEALAQAELAERFLGEFVDNRLQAAKRRTRQ